MTGNELRARREEMGLTQEQLSTPLGMAYQNVQKWEKAGDKQARIHPRHWNALAGLLAISVDEFYPTEEPEEEYEVSISASNGSSVANNGSTIASGGALVVSGSRNSMQPKSTDLNLRPLEKQAIELNRECGNDNILKGFINRLLDIKERTKDMY